MFITAQILIALSSVLYGISVFANNKKFLLAVQILSSCLYWTHCFLLHAWVGGIMSVLDTAKIIIFYIIEKLNGGKKAKTTSGVILLIVGIVCSAFSWEGWCSIFPLIGATIYVLSLAFSKLLMIKLATVSVTVCSSIYLFLIGSPVGAALELVAIFIGAVGIVLDLFKKGKGD